jgi:hypothetical protein
MNIKRFDFEKRITDVITSSIPALPCHLSGRKLSADGKRIVTRRYFLKSLAIGGIAVGLWPKFLMAENDSGNDQPQGFEWRVPSAHFDTVREGLRFDGEVVKEKDAKGLPLIYIFVGIALLPNLAKAILALRREIVHGGVVIDTRGKKIKIDTDKSLPGGVMVLVTPKDTQIYERDEIGNPSALVDVLLKAK